MKEIIRAALVEFYRASYADTAWTFDSDAADSDSAGPAEIPLNVPKDPEHGDLSSNIAMMTAKLCKTSPRELSGAIAAWCDERLPEMEVSVAGPGFLNFRFTGGQHRETLRRILAAGEAFGSSNHGGGERINLEFVSANPTGPPVVVSARAAAFGSTLARLLTFAGYEVTSEYYLNDAGAQVAALGLSLRARWRERQGAPLEIPENGYHGSYLADMANALDADLAAEWEAMPADAGAKHFADHAIAAIKDQMQSGMDRFRTPFDVWFSEKSLHESGKLDDVLRLFESKELVYEADGARWFRSTDFGDEKDRVLVKSDGNPTYFLADAAYHLDKFERGYAKAIDVLGPDHHGHMARMQAIARAIGAPEGWLEILLLQWVTLVDGDEVVAMSKRAGEFITMTDLIDDVGVDVARCYFLTRRRDSHLEFDMALAREQSSKSQVFYAQYATARIAGVLRKGAEAGLTIEACAAADRTLDGLEKSEEIELIKLLEQFPDIVVSAAKAREPNRLFNYLVDIATTFHKFYHEHQIISNDESLSLDRLALCLGVRQVLMGGLELMGVDAPERM